MTPATAVLAVLGAALFFALADICVKKALPFTTLITASLVTVAVQWLLYTAVILAAGTFSRLNLAGVIWFAVTGVLNPVLFLVFYLLGIQRIGVARSAPLKGSSPIFAFVCAFLVLGERLEVIQYIGIALAVGGIGIISTEGSGEPSREAVVFGSSKRHAAGEGSAAASRIRKIDYLLPILAGATTGVASVMLKIGLAKMNSPLLAAWIGVTVALVLLPPLAILFPPGERFGIRAPGLPWLILGAVAAAVAVYALILALSLGQVSVVTTLNQTSPLFVLILMAIFLRQLERITPRVVTGAILTVGGGILVSVIH